MLAIRLLLRRLADTGELSSICEALSGSLNGLDLQFLLLLLLLSLLVYFVDAVLGEEDDRRKPVLGVLLLQP